MKDLQSVLSAFHQATQCPVAVWMGDEKGSGALTTAISAGTVLAPDALPETEQGPVPTNGGEVITARLAGLKRIRMPYRHRFAFLRHKGAIPLAPKALGISLLRPWHRFHTPLNLHYWYRKPD